MFQSTLPNGERPDDLIMLWTDAVYVSIHAPERGATWHPKRPGRMRIVSIHAPERGATRSLLIIVGSGKVSIHAPERGATAISDIFLLTPPVYAGILFSQLGFIILLLRFKVIYHQKTNILRANHSLISMGASSSQS